MSVLAIERRV